MFIIQRFWANCTIFNTKLTLSEACHLLLMQIQLATFYRFAIFQEEVWHRCVSRCIAVWVNTEQAPPSPSSTHCTGVGEQLSSHPPTRESTHNHCVPRTPSLFCLIYRIMAAFVFTCCPFFNISQQERHPYLSCFKKYIPVPASPFLSNASHCWRSSPKSQRRLLA